MKGYKNVGLPKQPSLIIRDKRQLKACNNKNKKSQLLAFQKETICRKGLYNDKNSTYD